MSGSGTLTSEGAAQLKSTLNVSGAITAAAPLSSSSRLVILDLAEFKQDLHVSGALVQAGGTNQGSITANGVLNANGGIKGTSYSGSTTLEVQGDAYLKSALYVTGNYTSTTGDVTSNRGFFSNALTVTNGTATLPTVTATAAVSGATTITAGQFIGGGLNRHFINELTMSRPSVTTVHIGTGSCVDSTNSVFMNHTTSFNVAITTSGTNGLDLGSESGSHWYAVFLISGSVAGLGGLMSLSQTTPTMPSGFTHKRRLGWVRNDGSSNLLNFKMYGNDRERRVDWNEARNTTLRVLNGGNATSYTNIDCSSLKPPTAQETWFSAMATAGDNWIGIRSEDCPDASNGQVNVNPDIAALQVSSIGMTGSNLQYASTAADEYLNLAVLGYKDFL